MVMGTYLFFRPGPVSSGRHLPSAKAGRVGGLGVHLGEGRENLGLMVEHLEAVSGNSKAECGIVVVLESGDDDKREVVKKSLFTRECPSAYARLAREKECITRCVYTM